MGAGTRKKQSAPESLPKASNPVRTSAKKVKKTSKKTATLKRGNKDMTELLEIPSRSIEHYDKKACQNHVEDDVDDDAAPQEFSSKSDVQQQAHVQDHDPSYIDSALEARKLRHKKKRRRERLDPAILAAAQEDLEAKTQLNTAGTVSDIRSEFKGSRTKFDSDDESDNNAAEKRVVVRRKPRDTRQTATGLQVRRLESKPRGAQREVPAAVQDFVQSHFYGDRLRRVAKGTVNRQRKSGPAKVFVPGKKRY